MKHFLLTSTLLLLSSVFLLHPMELIEGSDFGGCDGTIRIDPHELKAFYALEENHRALISRGISSHQKYPFIGVEITLSSSSCEGSYDTPVQMVAYRDLPISHLCQLKTNNIIKLNMGSLDRNQMVDNFVTLQCIGNAGQRTSFEQDVRNHIALFSSMFFTHTIPNEMLLNLPGSGDHYKPELFWELVGNDIIFNIPGTNMYTWGKNGFINFGWFLMTQVKTPQVKQCWQNSLLLLCLIHRLEK